MVFCNMNVNKFKAHYVRHNPYFNRWFSAIEVLDMKSEFISVTILILIDGFLQYWFALIMIILSLCHNPYFNRWFSAI